MQPQPTRIIGLLLLSLLSACATTQPGRLSAATTGETRTVVLSPRPGRQQVTLSDAQFQATMARLLADIRLPARPPFRHRIALASWERPEEAMRLLIGDYLHWCDLRHQPGDCLELFDGDRTNLGPSARRTVALELAFGEAGQAMEEALRGALDATKMKLMLLGGIDAYMVMVLLPEPATKVLATGITVLLLAYIGSDSLIGLVTGYLQLRDEAEEASTFAELRAAGERFGRLMGGNTARGLVMAVAGAIGSSASLAVKAPGLPGYVQASQLLDVESGGQLQLGALGNVRAVSVGSGAVSVVVTPLAVGVAGLAMAAPPNGPPHGSQPATPPPSGPRRFKSFDAFKTAMGPAGPGQEWHHIVEQNPANIEQFGSEELQNTDNIIRLDKQLHQRISGFYSSKDFDVTSSENLTVRQWLSQQPIEFQRSFGLRAITRIKAGLAK